LREEDVQGDEQITGSLGKKRKKKKKKKKKKDRKDAGEMRIEADLVLLFF
jgi:hypothetical protein